MKGGERGYLTSSSTTKKNTRSSSADKAGREQEDEKSEKKKKKYPIYNLQISSIARASEKRKENVWKMLDPQTSGRKNEEQKE